MNLCIDGFYARNILCSLALWVCAAFLVGCEGESSEVEASEANAIEEVDVVKDAAGNVSIGIRPIASQVLSEEPMEVLFYLDNATDAAITILPWGTPLEAKMTADRFEVSMNGQLMPYSGRIVKRPAPRAEDYITLAAGEKKEAVVALSGGYDVSGSGDYEIALKTLVFQSPESDLLTPVVLEKAVTVTRQ